MAVIKTISIGELIFDCHVAGEETNEMVLFIHGFPESSIIWIRLLDSLAGQGFYCVAPNMRGYSKGACPKGIKNYQMDELCKDVIKLANALEKDRFHLVGHDWGAGIGWNVVYNHSDRIISWTALSTPHNRAYIDALRLDPVQKKKSRYVTFLRLPFIPELLIRRNDFKMFKRIWKNSSSEEVAYHLSIFRNKASLTGAINYYRANYRIINTLIIGDIITPTLYIWGQKDNALGETAAKATAEYIKGEFTFFELVGGHWLMQTNYSEVENAVTEHLNHYRVFKP